MDLVRTWFETTKRNTVLGNFATIPSKTNPAQQLFGTPGPGDVLCSGPVRKRDLYTLQFVRKFIIPHVLPYYVQQFQKGHILKASPVTTS